MTSRIVQAVRMYSALTLEVLYNLLLGMPKLDKESTVDYLSCNRAYNAVAQNGRKAFLKFKVRLCQGFYLLLNTVKKRV